MPVLGITGGIASGKSTVARALLRQVPALLFDADACAHQLLEADLPLRSALFGLFGLHGFSGDAADLRAVLREAVFSDPSKRKALESLIHPRIRESWVKQAESYRGSSQWLFVEIPLLYETSAEPHFDRVLVVACSEATQIGRLGGIRGIKREMAQKIIATQLDLGLKMEKADHVIWSECPNRELEAQVSLLVGWLKERYG
jgi:dephospho-CoA kinase